MTTDEAFAILGLRPGASVEEVRQAWHDVAGRTHPDAGGSAEEFQRAREAYYLVRSITPRTPRGACLTCFGSGRRRVRSGFSTVNLSCAACGGSGKVQP